jgi:ketosteroid isomerase-like protein
MPWFPDFVSAAELARDWTRDAGRADPVAEYFTALQDGDIGELETVWPGRVVIHDPRAGEVRGHRHLREFVRRNQVFFAERHARLETVAATRAGGRAVVEVLAHLPGDGGEVAWPIAVVAESPDDRSVEFRTYCSQWPVDGRRHLRPPVLEPESVHLGDIVGRHQAALGAGDVDGVLSTFEPGGYLRESFGPHVAHHGSAELRAYFSKCFSFGGGIEVQPCAVTDDGVRSALEFNYVRWGSHDLPAQAGMAVYERGPDGLLAAVRLYDDVEGIDMG